ncbi:MAG: hypothetical protein KGL25_07325 [Gammaproteobacteria bacterium]|nr:hypothetical protein [Gammaproteobacteria bacterium]
MNAAPPEPPDAVPETAGRAGRAAARALVRWNLAALGAGFAWFAYVDAPITDGAMWLFAAAVMAGFISLVTALVGSETRTVASGARTRRTALVLFCVAMGLLLAAATVTLNLKGAGGDDAGTPTTAVIPA